MKTDDLITVMAASAAPVAPGAARRRLATVCLVGAIAAAALFYLVLGPWGNLAGFMRTGPFWMKAGYTVWLAAAGYLLTERAARPGAAAGCARSIAGAAVLAMLALALINLGRIPPSEWRRAWMGGSALVCPFRIMIAAAPAFVTAALVLRGLAPTRLRVAGAAAGLLAGAVGATVYGLWCRETAAVFVACWYTLGIAACAAIGALLGPRVLRW
jgi:hypothetical protein